MVYVTEIFNQDGILACPRRVPHFIAIESWRWFCFNYWILGVQYCCFSVNLGWCNMPVESSWTHQQDDHVDCDLLNRNAHKIFLDPWIPGHEAWWGTKFKRAWLPHRTSNEHMTSRSSWPSCTLDFYFWLQRQHLQCKIEDSWLVFVCFCYMPVGSSCPTTRHVVVPMILPLASCFEEWKKDSWSQNCRFSCRRCCADGTGLQPAVAHAAQKMNSLGPTRNASFTGDGNFPYVQMLRQTFRVRIHRWHHAEQIHAGDTAASELLTLGGGPEMPKKQ